MLMTKKYNKHALKCIWQLRIKLDQSFLIFFSQRHLVLITVLIIISKFGRHHYFNDTFLEWFPKSGLLRHSVIPT